MKVTKPARITRLAIVLTMISLSIAAICSEAITPAFAQQSAIDIEELDLPEIPEIEAPEILERGDVIPCLPPPECLLPGAEVCIQACWPF